MEWSVYRQRRRSDSVLRGDRMPILSASSSLLLRLIVVVSAAVVALTHAYGTVAWVALPDATLTRFDLSTIQSEVGNPSGYLVSLVGMLVGVGLIGYVALRVRGIVPRPATLLLVAVVLFLLNAVATYFMPNVWRVHAVLARISFIVLIASQIALFGQLMMRRDWYIAWGTLVAAIVMFVLPKYFHVDLIMNIAGFDVNIILGLSEVAYLILFYTGMYRMIGVATRGTSG